MSKSEMRAEMGSRTNPKGSSKKNFRGQVSKVTGSKSQGRKKV